MTTCWFTPGFKRKTFKLCVLTRWDFNFCVRSSPLRGMTRVTWVVLLLFWGQRRRLRSRKPKVMLTFFAMAAIYVCRFRFSSIRTPKLELLWTRSKKSFFCFCFVCVCVFFFVFFFNTKNVAFLWAEIHTPVLRPHFELLEVTQLWGHWRTWIRSIVSGHLQIIALEIELMLESHCCDTKRAKAEHCDLWYTGIYYNLSGCLAVQYDSHGSIDEEILKPP